MGALAKAAHGELKPDEESNADTIVRRLCGLTLAEIQALGVGAAEFPSSRFGTVRVSTIFLWEKRMTHSGDVWETAVFFGGELERQQRYRSRQEALDGHAAWLLWAVAAARGE